MNSLVCDRFVSTLRNDAEKLKTLGQGGLNPTETRTFGNFKGVFSDRCEYMYSLYNLDQVFDCIVRLANNIVGQSIVNPDPEYIDFCATGIAFDLRGYVGALSEEVMTLEWHKLNGLRGLMREWLGIGLLYGGTQDDLRLFLRDYALSKICDVDSDTGAKLSQRDKDRFTDERVTREMLAFRSVLQVSRRLVESMFHNASYAEVLITDVSNVPLLNPGI